MKRENGFSLIELMVAIAITVTIVGGAMTALYQAQKSTQIVASQANTQDNLRAGMHFIVRDLTDCRSRITGSFRISTGPERRSPFRPIT